MKQIQEFYTKLSPKEKNMAHIAGGFILIALFANLFLYPFISKLESLNQDIAENKDGLTRDSHFLKHREKILKEREVFSVYQTDDAKAEEQIIADFLKAIELLASEAKINLSKLNPAEVTPKKGYVEYYANLECDGRLQDVAQFLHKIDSTPNLLRVEKINMLGNKASAEGVKASVKIAKLVIDPKTIGNYEFKSEAEAMTFLSSNSSASGHKKTKKNFPASTTSNNDNQGGSSGGGGGSGGTGSGGDGSGGGGGSGGTGDGKSGQTGGGNGGDAGGNDGAKNQQSGGQSAGGAGGSADKDLYLGGNAAQPQEEKKNDGSVQVSTDFEKGEGTNAHVSGDSGGEKEESTSQNSSAADSKSPVKKTKAQEEFEKSKETGRVRVKSFETIWNEFWGIKPKEKEDKPKQQESHDKEGYQSADYKPKKNLWERLLHKDGGSNEEE